MSVRDVFHLSVKNWAASFTLSADATVETAYPLSNCLNQISDMPAVIDMTSETSVTIQGTGATDYVANCLCLWNHNIPADATVQLLLYPNASYAGTPYDSTALEAHSTIPWGGFMAADPWSDKYESISNLKRQFIHFFDAFTFKSFKVVISGGTWENDTVSLDKLWLGPAYAFDLGPSYGAVFSIKDPSIHTRKPSGGIETVELPAYRSMNLDFNNVPDAEQVLAGNLLDYARKGGDVFASADPNNARGMAFRRSGIFRRMTDLDFVAAYFNGSSLGLALEEN
jgi:hypothetical protein